MTSERMTKLRDFATRYTAAWCSQDAASVAAFFSPSGSLTIWYTFSRSKRNHRSGSGLHDRLP